MQLFTTAFVASLLLAAVLAQDGGEIEGRYIVTLGTAATDLEISSVMEACRHHGAEVENLSSGSFKAVVCDGLTTAERQGVETLPGVDYVEIDHVIHVDHSRNL